LLLPSEKTHCQLFLFHYKKTLLIITSTVCPTHNHLRTVFFWVITQQEMVIPCGHFGTTFWSQFQGSSTTICCIKIHQNTALIYFKPKAWNHTHNHLLNFYRHLLSIIFINHRNRCQIWYGKSTVWFMRHNEVYSSGMHHLAVWIASQPTRQKCSKALTQELQISRSHSHYCQSITMPT
jgi:hypothetical protein